MPALRYGPIYDLRRILMGIFGDDHWPQRAGEYLGVSPEQVKRYVSSSMLTPSMEELERLFWRGRKMLKKMASHVARSGEYKNDKWRARHSDLMMSVQTLKRAIDQHYLTHPDRQADPTTGYRPGTPAADWWKWQAEETEKASRAPRDLPVPAHFAQTSVFKGRG